jgi:hypothetical protein
MYSIDFLSAEAMMTMQVKEAHRQAKAHSLLRQMAVVQQGWLSQHQSYLLRLLGHGLVAVGEQLEQHGLPQSSV